MQSSEELLLASSNDNDKPAFQALQHLKMALQHPNNNYQASSAQSGVSTGTCFIEELNAHDSSVKPKKLAVFKDQKGDPLSPDNPSLIATASRAGASIVNFFGYRTSNQNTVTGQGYASDIVSSLLFNRLNELVDFDKLIVPNAILAENIYLNGLEKQKGILIEFIDDTKSLEDFDLSKLPSTISLEAFEQLAVFDYLIGNNDGKPGNILLQPDKDILYHIDNSWAFSPMQGERMSIHQYAFGCFSVLMNEKFSDATRSKIEKIFAYRHELALKVFNQFNELRAPNQTHELNLQRAMCFLHRIEMLHYLICINDATFSDISNKRFEVDFLETHQMGVLKLSPCIINMASGENLYGSTLAYLADSIAALHYMVLYSIDESLSEKQQLLHKEVIRLTTKAIKDNYRAKGMGAHVIDIENKADICCKQYYEHVILLKHKGLSASDIDDHIDSELKNPESALYKALSAPIGVGGKVFHNGSQYINNLNVFPALNTTPIWQTCPIKEILEAKPAPREGLDRGYKF